MNVRVKPHHIAPRLTTGAFMLSSGLRKLQADEEAAQGLHGMATTAYPFLEGIPPRRFTRLLAAAEVCLGTALLFPLVPTAAAGAGLTVFASGLVGLYLRTPGTHPKGNPLPTDQGVPLAKDSWLLGIGLGLLSDPQSWPDRRRPAARRWCRR